jgi:hypothetical protein
MRLSSKVLIVAMIVMMICCVSAASATDVDDLAVSEDADIIEVDDAADSVDIVEQDDSSDDIIEDVDDSQIDETDDDIVADEKVTTDRGIQSQIDNGTVSSYFDTTTGHILSSAPSGLQFVGTFSNLPFDYFIIDQSVSLSFANAQFENVGFKLLYPGLIIDGATFNMNAPANDDCYVINVENANGTQILGNTITYNCGYGNPDNYNYVIKVKNSTGVKVADNTITATLPLKTVKHYTPGIEGLDKDFVAGVGVTNSNYFNFTNNTVDITGILRDGDYPTLDAVIIWYSNNSYIGENSITEKDTVTTSTQYSYIYGIDVYECNDINIHNNTVRMNADASGGQVGGNGTGAAYCVQLTGPHTGVVVSDNTLVTKNHGPNLGIYSQNYNGATNITVRGNTIDVTGNAGTDEWSLVSGMELQDTYATVTGNTITVTNIGGYSASKCVYGISYSQATTGTHTFIITNNTVNVATGKYAVYLKSAVNSNISNNYLQARSYHGNGAVHIVSGSNNTVSGNTP